VLLSKVHQEEKSIVIENWIEVFYALKGRVGMQRKTKETPLLPPFESVGRVRED